MQSKSRLIALVLGALAVLSTAPALAQAISPSARHAAGATAGVATPVETAGRLRALAQRLSKLYLQLRLNLEQESAQARLADGIAQFDAQLALLQRGALSEAASRSLARIATQWTAMRPRLQQMPSDAMGQSIADEAEQLALTAQKLALQLELADDVPVIRLADLAQRNDMLAQRLARIYLQIKAGHSGQSQQVDLAQTRREFATGMLELQGAPENDGAILGKLRLAQEQWRFFERAVMSGQRQDEAAMRVAMRNVATTSERISEVMEEIAGSYRRMARMPLARN